MRGFLLGLAISLAFIIGCLSSQYLLTPAHAQSSRGVTRWTYRCERIGGGVDNVTRTLRASGTRGWELVDIEMMGSTAIACYKGRSR